LAVCQRSFVQGARSDGGIVVKQSDAFERFAGVIEIAALELDLPASEPGSAIPATAIAKPARICESILRYCPRICCLLLYSRIAKK